MPQVPGPDLSAHAIQIFIIPRLTALPPPTHRVPQSTAENGLSRGDRWHTLPVQRHHRAVATMPGAMWEAAAEAGPHVSHDFTSKPHFVSPISLPLCCSVAQSFLPLSLSAGLAHPLHLSAASLILSPAVVKRKTPKKTSKRADEARNPSSPSPSTFSAAPTWD